MGTEDGNLFLPAIGRLVLSFPWLVVCIYVSISL